MRVPAATLIRGWQWTVGTGCPFSSLLPRRHLLAFLRPAHCLLAQGNKLPFPFALPTNTTVLFTTWAINSKPVETGKGPDCPFLRYWRSEVEPVQSDIQKQENSRSLAICRKVALLYRPGGTNSCNVMLPRMLCQLIGRFRCASCQRNEEEKNSMRVKGINVLHYCYVMHFTNIILFRSSSSAPAVEYTPYERREMNNEEMAGVFPLGDEDWESRATVGVRNAVLALGKLALAESTLILTDVGCLGNKAVPDWRREDQG